VNVMAPRNSDRFAYGPHDAGAEMVGVSVNFGREYVITKTTGLKTRSQG
jgi:hypothetical protein